MRYAEVVSSLLLLLLFGTGFGVCSVAFSRDFDGFRCLSGKHCGVDGAGRSSDVCSLVVCLSIDYDPVCGGDSRTYDSICELQRQACRRGVRITVTHKGTCEEGGSIKARKRRQRSRRRYRREIPLSTGETSPFSPLYTSLKTSSTTTTAKSKDAGGGGGDDVGCEGTVCPPDRYCVENIAKGSGVSCVCYDECSSIRDPVCGSNFVTYNNECQLMKESCSSSANITRLFRGSCTDKKRPLDPLENRGEGGEDGEGEGEGGGGGRNHANRFLTSLLGIWSWLVVMRG